MLARANNRILLNIDMKSDNLSDRVAAAVMNAGMAGQVLMKAKVDGPDDIAWAWAQKFCGRIGFMPLMSAHPQYFAKDLQKLRILEPTMVEVAFSDLQHLEAGRSVLHQQNILLWVNTLDVCHNLDLCDARALKEPDAVWGALIEAGVGAIQTDETQALVAYLRQRGLR
jgi:glycerophosphoryl diester phosphodiesterase